MMLFWWHFVFVTIIFWLFITTIIFWLNKLNGYCNKLIAVKHRYLLNT